MKTTQALLAQFQTLALDDMKKQLEALPMKKSVRETLLDGARDGMRILIHHLKESGSIEILSPESILDEHGEPLKVPT